MHASIKDKVQLYRDTIESGSDKLPFSNKQTSPLVLTSKAKTKEKAEQSDSRKKANVGQKRRYEMIQNIAAEIESKQKETN